MPAMNLVTNATNPLVAEANRDEIAGLRDLVRRHLHTIEELQAELLALRVEQRELMEMVEELRAELSEKKDALVRIEGMWNPESPHSVPWEDAAITAIEIAQRALGKTTDDLLREFGHDPDEIGEHIDRIAQDALARARGQINDETSEDLDQLRRLQRGRPQLCHPRPGRGGL